MEIMFVDDSSASVNTFHVSTQFQSYNVKKQISYCDAALSVGRYMPTCIIN